MLELTGTAMCLFGIIACAFGFILALFCTFVDARLWNTALGLTLSGAALFVLGLPISELAKHIAP
jgi:hypothetical protein